MKKIFKKIFLASSFLLFGIGAIVISFVIFPLLAIFKENPRKSAAHVVQNSWKFLINYMQSVRLIKVNYPEEIKNIKNKIIVASHPSYIDIVILISLIPNSVCLAKKALLDNFFMKNIIKMLYITNDIDVETFESESKIALDDGYNIIIFPTGGRVLEGEDVHIHKGASSIAIKNNIEIVPIKINISHPFLQKNHGIFELSDNIVEYDLIIQDSINPENYNDCSVSDISLRKKICKVIKEKIL